MKISSFDNSRISYHTNGKAIENPTENNETYMAIDSISIFLEQIDFK